MSSHGPDSYYQFEQAGAFSKVYWWLIADSANYYPGQVSIDPYWTVICEYEYGYDLSTYGGAQDGTWGYL